MDRVEGTREILSVFIVKGLERMTPHELPGWEITDPSLFCILGFVFLFLWNPGGP